MLFLQLGLEVFSKGKIQNLACERVCFTFKTYIYQFIVMSFTHGMNYQNALVNNAVFRVLMIFCEQMTIIRHELSQYINHSNYRLKLLSDKSLKTVNLIESCKISTKSCNFVVETIDQRWNRNKLDLQT